MKKEEIQHHAEALQIIKSLKKQLWGTFARKSSDLDSIKARLSPKGKKFSVSFTNDRSTKKRKKIDFGDPYINVPFQTKAGVLILESIYLHHHSPPKFIGAVNSFYSKGYSKVGKYYYRLIIPLEHKISFHFSIEEYVFATNLGYRSRTGTKANINEDELFVSLVDDRKRNFLCIESKRKQDFGAFSEKAFALKNAIGYVTGYMAGDRGFFFAYSSIKMVQPKYYYFNTLRDTIKSGYVPINANPFSILFHDKKLAQEYYDKKIVRPINTIELSTLSQRLHDSVEFSSVIMLMLESSVASLLFMPGGYAIALESLADIINGKRKERLTPINNNKFSKKVRRELLDVIETNAALEPSCDWKTLRIRIEQINQMTNKARLRSPFTLLGIDLKDEDIKILETRNDFLHGRIPDITGAGIDRSLDRKNKDLYYAAMRFYTLLNMLILKWIGYENYVINHPKIQENCCKIFLDEEPYRKV